MIDFARRARFDPLRLNFFLRDFAKLWCVKRFYVVAVIACGSSATLCRRGVVASTASAVLEYPPQDHCNIQPHASHNHCRCLSSHSLTRNTLKAKCSRRARASLFASFVRLTLCRPWRVSSSTSTASVTKASASFSCHLPNKSCSLTSTCARLLIASRFKLLPITGESHLTTALPDAS